VNNNQKGTFSSVLQQPFVSTNASDTVATTSFGGTQDAGTTVTVQPTIAEDNQLVLDYEVSISEFVGDAPTPEIPPPRQQNDLKSIVTIPDGSAVVLGGLEIVESGEGGSGVPWLVDFPLVGWLFGDRTTSSSKSKFYVFLRATVFRNDSLDGLRNVSAPLREQMDVESGAPQPELLIMR